MHAPTPDSQCQRCQAVGRAHMLVQDDASEGGQATIRVCPRCLSIMLHRKADLSQSRNRTLVRDWAREQGLQVWASSTTIYALDPTDLPRVRTLA